MIPAQQTRMSRRPNSSTAALTSFSTDSRSVTSHWTPIALPPSPEIFLAVSSVVSGFMSETTTAAPSAASRAAQAAPMPRPLPVMTATLSSNRVTQSTSLKWGSDSSSLTRSNATSTGIPTLGSPTSRRASSRTPSSSSTSATVKGTWSRNSSLVRWTTVYEYTLPRPLQSIQPSSLERQWGQTGRG